MQTEKSTLVQIYADQRFDLLWDIFSLNEVGKWDLAEEQGNSASNSESSEKKKDEELSSHNIGEKVCKLPEGSIQYNDEENSECHWQSYKKSPGYQFAHNPKVCKLYMQYEDGSKDSMTFSAF